MSACDVCRIKRVLAQYTNVYFKYVSLEYAKLSSNLPTLPESQNPPNLRSVFNFYII